MMRGDISAKIYHISELGVKSEVQIASLLNYLNLENSLLKNAKKKKRFYLEQG
jgi:hypothetical protein